MLLKAIDYEYNFKKRDLCIDECQKAVNEGKMDTQTMEELCDIERFAPFPWNIGQNCFCCGEKLTLPAIIWRGSDPSENAICMTIAMHPDCVLDMFNGLKDDWHEYDMVYRPGGQTYDPNKPDPYDGKRNK